MQPGDDAALLLGFLNTVHLPDGVDALAGSNPAQWVADGRQDDGRSAHEMSDPASPAPAGGGLASLVVVREGLRALLARRDGEQRGCDPVAGGELVAAADAVMGSVTLRVSLDLSRTGRPEPTPAPEGGAAGEDELAAVAAAVLRCQLDDSLDRVKVCARPACRWAFYDASRNRSRHWCSMAGCGNVEKNRAYRARRSPC